MGYSGTLGWILDNGQMVVVFSSAKPGDTAAFDMVNNEASSFPDNPLFSGAIRSPALINTCIGPFR